MMFSMEHISSFDLVERLGWYLIGLINLTVLLMAVQNYSTFRVHYTWTLFVVSGWIVLYLFLLGMVYILVSVGVSKYFGVSVLPLAISWLTLAGFILYACLNYEAINDLVFQSGHPIYLWGIRFCLLTLLFGSILLVIPDSDVLRLARISLTISSLGVIVLFLPFQGYSIVNTNPKSLPSSRQSSSTIIIGIDGADWDQMDPLIERGDLPNLSRLRKDGVWGTLGTIEPTHSPIIWTTVATGLSMKDHGVKGFAATRFPGLSQGLTDLDLPRGLNLGLVFYALPQSYVTVNGQHRNEPAYWNLLTWANQTILVNNWWASWPADPINGLMVTERVHYRKRLRGRDITGETRITHPPQLFQSIRDMLLKPTEISYESADKFLDVPREKFNDMKQTQWKHHDLETEFPFVYSMFESNRRLTLDLMDRSINQGNKQADVMTLFRMMDLLGHSAMKYSSLVNNHGQASDTELRQYDTVLSQGYRSMDRAIGQIVSRYDSPNVVILSDHGFEAYADTEAGKVIYGHADAPDGVFIGHGPAFGRGEVKNLDIFDVLPLLVYLKGIPVSEKLEGHVPRNILEDDFVDRRPLKTVEEYPYYLPPEKYLGSGEANESMLNHLRGIGYIE